MHAFLVRLICNTLTTMHAGCETDLLALPNVRTVEALLGGGA